MTVNTRPSTFIVATFIILETQKTKYLNKRSVKKGLDPLQINSNEALVPTLPSTTKQNSTIALGMEATELNIMVEESPGGALFVPPNTDVIYPPVTAVIATPNVIEEAEEYVLRTPTRGPITPPTGETKTSTDAVAPVPVNLPANSPRSSPKRAT